MGGHTGKGLKNHVLPTKMNFTKYKARPHTKLVLSIYGINFVSSHSKYARREIHAVRILPPPVVHSEHFGLLTGSEDGSIICHHHTRSLSGQMMHRHEEIGMHIGGTAVRAIALFPECSGGGLCDITQDARSYILLSAGAKEVIMAWRIEWIRTDGFDASSGEASYNDMWEIRTTCLGAREQTKESKKSNQRCMAVVLSLIHI